jgi:hypothetical protein
MALIARSDFSVNCEMQKVPESTDAEFMVNPLEPGTENGNQGVCARRAQGVIARFS